LYSFPEKTQRYKRANSPDNGAVWKGPFQDAVHGIPQKGM